MSENMQTCTSCGELVPTEYVVCVWCGFDLTSEHIRRSGIQIGRKEAVQRMKRVITDPMTVFKEISLLPDLVGGRLILYLIGVMITLNMLAIFRKLDGLSFNNTETVVTITGSFSIPLRTILNIVFLIAQPLVLYLIFYSIWKISARILSVLSRSVGGRGDREKIRASIGYSLLPVLLAWSVSWLIRLISTKQTVGSISFDGVETALVGVAEQGLGAVAIIFLYIGWIWTTVLGIIGMKNVGRLSWAEAILIAGIPYVLFLTVAL